MMRQTHTYEVMKLEGDAEGGEFDTVAGALAHAKALLPEDDESEGEGTTTTISIRATRVV